ncbi:ATP-binding cassette domain-containing protein [Dactylosporangium sp. CA-233914]|uniref:ATP-binding cassette domain-containing protein n=1 Tax=Dactylosporangium sp. CA-233914 TaxID=3239934 RepID=UPI003D94464A
MGEVGNVAVPRPLLDVRGLSKTFRQRVGTRLVARPAVDSVDLRVEAGQTYGIVGESGSGKTTMGRMVMRLLPPSAGTIELNGRDVTRASSRELRQFRRDVQMVFQDPYSALNPRFTIGTTLGETLQIQGLAKSRRQARDRVVELLELVDLKADHARRFPHEMSGGQRQRICVARALAGDPKLVVCDEPTSSLDVSVQANILNLLRRLQTELGLAYLFISHNISVIAYMSHQVGVMHNGRLVESGTTAEVLSDPKDPYTKSLLEAVPALRVR